MEYGVAMELVSWHLSVKEILSTSINILSICLLLLSIWQLTLTQLFAAVCQRAGEVLYDRPLSAVGALGVFLFRLRAFIGSATEAVCVCVVGSEVQNMPPCTGTPFDVCTVLSVGCFQ